MMASKVELYRIYICGLPPDVERRYLKFEFDAFGEIYYFHFHADKGYALISYKNQKDAILAIANANNKIIGGYPIQVQWANGYPRNRDTRYKGHRFDSVYNETCWNNCMVFCWGLNGNNLKNKLQSTFGPFGIIQEMFTDVNSFHPDTAIIQFNRKEDATLAICTIDGIQVDGRTVRCDWCSRPISHFLMLGWQSIGGYQAPFQPAALPPAYNSSSASSTAFGTPAVSSTIFINPAASPSTIPNSTLRTPTVSSTMPNSTLGTPTASSTTTNSTLRTPTVSSTMSNSTLGTPTASSATPNSTLRTPTASSTTPNSTLRTPTASSTAPSSTLRTPTASSATPNSTLRTPTAPNSTLRSPTASSPTFRTPAASSLTSRTCAVSSTTSRTPAVLNPISKPPAAASSTTANSAESNTIVRTPVASETSYGFSSDVFSLRKQLDEILQDARQLSIAPSVPSVSTATSNIRPDNITSTLSSTSAIYRSDFSAATSISSSAVSASSNEEYTNDDFDTVFDETGPNSCIVYCNRLNKNTTKKSLKEIFSPFGIVEEINLHVDRSGYALIRFNTKEAATLAICSINNSKINGCSVKCTWSSRPDYHNPQSQMASVGDLGLSEPVNTSSQPCPLPFCKPSTSSTPSSLSAATSALLPKQDKSSETEKEKKRNTDIFCKICMDEELGVVFLPCGHLTSCSKCAKKIYFCPLCRSLITSTIRTYLS